MDPPKYISPPIILPEDGPDAREITDDKGRVLAIRKTGGTARVVDPNTDAVARTAYGEARGEPSGGMAAVAAVIKNRSDQSGQSYDRIVHAPGQFDAWVQQRNRLNSLRTDDPGYASALEAVLPILTGEAPDPTGGATEFFNPAKMPPTYRAGEGVIIGNHKFVSGYWHPPGWRPPTRIKAPSPYSEFDLPPARPIGTQPRY